MTMPPAPTRPSEDTGLLTIHALLDRLPDLVFIMSRHATVCYANQACADFLGRPVTELLGMNALDLVHPDDRGLAVESLGDTAAKGPGIREPVVLRALTGGLDEDGHPIVRPFEIIAHNLLDDPLIDGILISSRDLTNREQAIADAALLQQRFEVAFERAPFPRAVVAPDGRLLRANPAMVALSGYDHEHLVGMHISELAHPEELSEEAEIARQLIDGTIEHHTAERRLRHADGHEIWVLRTFWITPDPAGGTHYVSCSLIDLSERREAEHRVLQLIDVLESSNEIVAFTDAHGKIEYLNRRAREVLGISEGDNPRNSLDQLMSHDTVVRVMAELIPAVRESGVWRGELSLRSTTGDEIPVTATIQFHHDEHGEVGLVSSIAHDIRALKDVQRQLEHQATHDALTMLPNRSLFEELGEQALARASREGTTVAVLFLDLDRFKQVNDTFGHSTGDDLLVEIAGRLRECVRRGDVVARFGGDEFVVCCEHPAGRTEMSELAGRLIDAASNPATLGSVQAQVGLSIGIAIGAGPRVTIDNLLRDADAALYQAKEAGRGRAIIFGAPPAGSH